MLRLEIPWPINTNGREFPGGPAVKTSPSNPGGAGSVPGQGANLLHALWPKSQSIKQK